MGALVLVLMTLGLWAAGPRIGRTCTPPYCSGGYFLPGTGQVPANVGAIWWSPYYESWLPPVVDASNVGIYQLVDLDEVAVAFTLESLSTRWYLLRLDEDLAAGSTYLLRCDDLCREGTPIQTSFVAAASAPFPETLGALVAHEPLIAEIRVATPSGSCDTQITAAIVDLELQLDAGAEPWADVFEYSTYVDGERWGPSASLGSPGPTWELGGSWMGRARDRVYVLCAATDPNAAAGVEEGAHTAFMRAELPGREEILESTSVSFELYCLPQVDDDLVEDKVDAAEEDVADVPGGDTLPDTAEPADGFPDEHGGCGCTLP